MFIPALFVFRSVEIQAMNENSKETEESEWRWRLIQSRFQEYKIVKAFELFRKHKIEPILIKGWAAAINYPQKESRVFGDIDLCVAPEDYKKALKILDLPESGELLVDLHNGLRHLDTTEWTDLFENTKLVQLETTMVRILRPEDHLRVLCVHWLNDGAAYRERLWDIFYAVENRPQNFDWDRCLNVVDKKRRKWIVCAIRLAQKYLGLKLTDTPLSEEKEEIPKWVIQTVEKEWADEIHLKRLQDCLTDRNEFFRQVKKRFPPNPIQATIDVNGEFDNKPRIFYQIADIFIRLKPSLQRFAEMYSRN